MSLPGGDKGAPITCVLNVPVQSHVSDHLGLDSQHVPRV
jgi:hypothetical protein